MYDTDPADLIEFATRWAALGEAVTEQVARVLDDPSCGNCWEAGSEDGVNPSAIQIAYEQLQGLNAGLDEMLEEFLDSVGEEAEGAS